MYNDRTTFPKRILSFFMAIVLIVAMIPLQAFQSFAETPEPEKKGVTVTVLDQEGKPLLGAKIKYSIDSISQGSEYAKGEAKTDERGEAQILTQDKYIENDLFLNAEVSLKDYTYAEDYEDFVNVKISSSEQNYVVRMRSTVITDVKVQPIDITYDGEEHDAATITGIQPTDTVTYRLNDEKEQSVMPKIQQAGTYSLEVRVEREGFSDYTTVVNSVIRKAEIQLTVREYRQNYDGQSHNALEIEGLEDIDTVTFSLNGGNPQDEMPTIKDVGHYTVTLHVVRPNYEDFDKTYSNIEVVATTIPGLTARAYTGPYDREFHNAVEVFGTKKDDKIEYKLGDNGTWTESIPQIIDPGEYKVFVRVTRKNYAVTDVEIIPSSARIEKAKQILAFKNYRGNGASITIKGSLPYSQEFDFSATDVSKLAGGTITYSFTEKKEDPDSQSPVTMAEIDDQTGVLKVYYPGVYVVTATLTGNDKYKDCSISYELTVKSEPSENSEYIYFEKQEVSYTFGANNGVASENKAIRRNHNISGHIDYSLEDQVGLHIERRTGKVTIADKKALAEAIKESGGLLRVTVKAVKKKALFYAEDTATYTLLISFATAPTNPYVVSGEKGDHGWYKGPVTVTPVGAYQISKDDPNHFGESVVFDDEGDKDRTVYLQNMTDGEHYGEITNPIAVAAKIDSVRPSTENMQIHYSKSIVDQVLNVLTLGFYNPSVTVTFEASDENSGVDHLEWTYTREQDASVANLESEKGTLNFDDEGRAELVLTGDEAKQYRGHLSFKVTDKAGNTSDEKTDEDHVIIVDTISPNCLISYSDPISTVGLEDKKQRFFDGEIPLTVTVTENNFVEGDFILEVSKNGEDPIEVPLEWKKSDQSDNVYIGSYTIGSNSSNVDGDYVITAEYKDLSENEGQFSDPYNEEKKTVYQSDVLTIDETDPIIHFSYDDKNQRAKVTVTEHNFRPEGITANLSVKDRNGKAIQAKDLTEELRKAKWSQDKDTYTYTTTNFKDGIYSLGLEYRDPANRVGKTSNQEFVIDHSKPSLPKIEFSKPILDLILEGISFGFYNPNVTVTFTSYDDISGVDYFTWSYERQKKASPSNVAEYKEKRLKAVEDSRDKSKFTASITLPADEAEQLRGYFTAKATDRFKNTSDKTTRDGQIIVVDTVSPTMTVEYSKESNKVGSTLYYGQDKKGQVEIRLNVQEANFFAEDVRVKLFKDGREESKVKPTWTDVSTDQHVGKLLIHGDGRYVMTVEYTDKSNNKMQKYTSNVIILDSVKPKIKVEYNTSPVLETLVDQEGKTRKYYDRAQQATVTVIERNFDPEKVAFQMVGEDSSGAKKNLSQLVDRSNWETSGDTHKIRLNFTGDANYSFAVDCRDLAGNLSKDNSTDYFTIDSVAPRVLNVSYSSSILDTVLSGISFGFYNAKVKVTVTLADETSGVHQFDYSYLTAAGVSSVNSQLLHQIVDEGNIRYSNGGKTATITFEVPKSLLNENNQFNGSIKFNAIDRSHNKVERSESKRLVVDNISPSAKVTYNDPVNTKNGISYFNDSISGTITMTEANFYPEDVVALVSKDGKGQETLPITWTDASVDRHIGSFQLSDDGDYIIHISYKDKSGNSMVDYTSNQLTLDKKIEKPSFTINGVPQSGENGGAYKGALEMRYAFEDQNYESNSIQLLRTRFDKQEDVTDEFIRTQTSEHGGSGMFTIPEEVKNDGIYLLTVTMTDKANHKVESHIKFTVNRFGSVYEYSDYLCSLIKDGGQYIKKSGDSAITQDIVITEYNADQVLPDSLKILITRDGEPIDVDYKQQDVSSKGWFKYLYTISKSNFAEDGVYKITLSSQDATGNTSTSVPENSMNSEGERIIDVMQFTVDTVAPEIQNIINLENSIVRKDLIVDGKLNVKYKVHDIGGLKEVKIYVNGQLIDTVKEFENRNSYTGNFYMNESNDVQSVRLVVTDLAGNVTDTQDASFDPGDLYTFHDQVTVTTNFLIRWYRNTPLFWGSIAGVAALLALIFFLIGKRKKKEEDQESK